MYPKEPPTTPGIKPKTIVEKTMERFLIPLALKIDSDERLSSMNLRTEKIKVIDNKAAMNKDNAFDKPICIVTSVGIKFNRMAAADSWLLISSAK